MVTFLWRAYGSPKPSSGKGNPFTDVSASDYFCDAVLWAVSKNIVAGTSETTFSPNQTCSTAHIVTYLYRAANLFEDGWWIQARVWTEACGLNQGITSTISPDVSCTRADAVSYLYNYFTKKQSLFFDLSRVTGSVPRDGITRFEVGHTEGNTVKSGAYYGIRVYPSIRGYANMIIGFYSNDRQDFGESIYKGSNADSITYSSDISRSSGSYTAYVIVEYPDGSFYLGRDSSELVSWTVISD